MSCSVINYNEIAVDSREPGNKIYRYTPASGWFGNDSIAVRGDTYDSKNSAGSAYTSNYEQYYMTNDVITLTMNCEEGKLTLTNERTNKEYHMFIDDAQYGQGRLPCKLYINLYFPGDKIRLLSLEDD